MADTPAIEGKTTVPLEDVLLKHEWTFWENYESKAEKENFDYNQSLSEIFNFNTIIDFWQFWNAYPGSDPKNIFFNGDKMKYFFTEKLRITAMNLFKKGIRPQWEDPQNKGGTTFSMEYEVGSNFNEFFSNVKSAWLKLMLSLIGETANGVEHLNGIRFVDKSRLNKKAKYRFELWFSSSFPEDKVKDIKQSYGNDYGCSGIVSRSM